MTEESAIGGPLSKVSIRPARLQQGRKAGTGLLRIDQAEHFPASAVAVRLSIGISWRGQPLA